MNTKTIRMPYAGINKILLTALLAAAIIGMPAFFAPQAFAKDNKSYGAAQGGYSGPGPSLVTVEQAKGMRDDAKVVLQGYIVQSLGGDHYMFKDDTGNIMVDIDMKVWAGQQVGPDDLVEIYGEVEKEWFEPDEIDVKRLIKR